jgi:ATP-binding cassette subfamily B protein
MSQPIPLKEAVRQALRLDRAVRLVWRSAPGWTLVNLALLVVQGLLPLAGLYVMKRLIDSLAAGLTSSDPAASFRSLFTWLVVAASVAVATVLARSLGELARLAQAQLVIDAVSDLIHAQSIAVDLGFYEDPAYFDTLHRAQQESPYRPTRIVNGLVQLGQNGISMVGVAGLLLSSNSWAGLALFAAALPAAFVRIVHSRRLFRFEEQQTERERRAWYYHWILTGAVFAKEVRLFNLGPLFKERFRNLRKALREGRLSLSRRRLLVDFLAQALASMALFTAFGFTAWQALHGALTLGDLVMVYLGFQSGLGFLQAILRELAGLYEDNLFLTNFYRFLDLTPKIQSPANPRPLPAKITRGLAFEAVHFTYPGAARPALESVNLTLAPGQVIALVGENGSGKTTLIKLMCMLYQPDAGRITLDGLDLHEVDPVRWQREISVTFQDYVHYSLTAWENIWLGDVERPPDRERIEAAARRAGAEAAIRRLPKGYDTTLGSLFEAGKELSTGEWQKVALARSFLREARIIVLDEPTSSLDPLAEAALFQRFRTLIDGRSAVLISHRFSTVQMADYIYVLEEGKIVEHGSHQELLERGGLYARMYLAQAGLYQVGVSPM